MEHISIHALREEGDGAPHPAGARTQHFYPRPPRGGRRLGQTGRATQFPISIYALREEGDRTLTGKWPKARAFLSTPSARRATLQCLVTWSSHRYFYPRPPRGGRPSAAGQHAEPDRFLSTPSARRATPRPQKWPWYKKFLSTPSARRATSVQINMDYNHIISIHALREEGDTVRPSRLPNVAISIHALREEGDPKPCATPAPTNDFYPRPPRGGRLMCAVLSPSTSNFYPRPPRGGRPACLGKNSFRC